MKSQLQSMLDGELYFSEDEDLKLFRQNARELTKNYNNTLDMNLLSELFKQKLKNVTINPSFHCDYGFNIELGENVYMNYNCIILDCAHVKIGNNTMFAPNVQLYTATHPIDVKTRNSGYELAFPITIGENCWLGGGVIVLPNVTIGDNCVIGAGSVVTKNIPPNSIAVGNPCKVIKQVVN